MRKLINDPFFNVTIDENSKQVSPEKSIWAAMHTCVDGGSSNITAPENAADAIIRHALKFGHWSVLEHASIKLDFHGFPHDTAMQFRTHQGVNTLCQSLRYSDERYTSCANGNIDPSELFYFGDNLTASDKAKQSCQDYAEAITKGEKKESARRFLLAGYRQSFTISGTFRRWMHVLDQRLLADTQIEAQTAAWMALDLLCEYSPLFVWYRDTRAGKNLLAP